MSTFVSQTVSGKYTELLHVTGGVTSTLTDVEGGDGTASNLQISTTQTSGDFYSKTIWLRAADFGAVEGSPALTDLGDGIYEAEAYAFDDAAAEVIGCWQPCPAAGSGSTVTATAYWCMGTAASGTVLLYTHIKAIAVGETTEGSATYDGDFSVVPGTAKYMTTTTFPVAQAWAEDDMLRISFVRDGTNGSDDAGGDLYFLGMKLEFS